VSEPKYICSVCGHKYKTRRWFYVCTVCAAITCKRCIGKGCDTHRDIVVTFSPLLLEIDRLKEVGFDMRNFEK
jgi:hypothetical protein